MCRHVAAVGPPAPLASVVLDGTHSLHDQSFRARELKTGTVCADGYGIGWYDADVRPEPARLASAMPIWSAADLPGLAAVVRSRCTVAAVRNGTVAGANTEANCAPFASGRHLWSLNGDLGSYAEAWHDTVREWTTPERRRLLRGTTDGEHLFQAFLSILDTLDPEPGALATATKTLTRQVADHAAETQTAARLNLLVADGTQVVATRWGTDGEGNSLYLLRDGKRLPGTSIVASEPLDEDDWEPVDPQSMVVVQAAAPPVRMRL